MDIGVDIGLVYHIDDAHQFWAELEDTLRIPETATLSQIDGRLRLYVSLCATYHQQYLQTQLQLEHACTLLLDSELFAFHSERMSHLVIDDAVTNSNPHAQLILHKTLLLYGRAHSAFLRSQAKWAPLLPILMDHVAVDVDFDAFAELKGANAQAVPIEARLMTLAVGILYEVCRVQKFDITGLRIFNDRFIETLFDLVEETRNLADETLNYTTIKLILALNEQFMVAALPEKDHAHAHSQQQSAKALSASRNRVLQILVARGASSKTFAENIIFMLNRAGASEEDLCMQLLVLKILYLLFTTASTHEYFYTNDLCVLVDVFLRELADLPDESEALRHTYLRVLSPLLTNTQLRAVPYKRAQIVRTLNALVDHGHIRDVSPTTRRLVQRCLAAEWAKPVVAQMQARRGSGDSASEPHSPTSPSSMSSFASVMPLPAPALPATKSMLGAPTTTLKRDKSLRSSASASDLKAAAATQKPHLRVATPPHNGSMVSLAVAQAPSHPTPTTVTGKGVPRAGLLGVRHPQRGVSLGEVADSLRDTLPATDTASLASSSSGSPTPPLPDPERASSLDAPPPVRQRTTSSPYRRAPPPPPGAHRRKAPPPPTTATANGHTITPIARSRPAVVL